MDTKSIIPHNSSNNQLIQLALEQSKDSSFHDRAAIVVRDILQQIGFNEEKLRRIAGVISAINMFPSIGPIGQAQDMLKDVEPLMLMIQNNSDPSIYLKAIPREKMEYLINLVIARLEWIKYGNSEQENNQHKEQENNS